MSDKPVRPQAAIRQGDDLAGDLRQIITDSAGDASLLLTKLTSYVVRRDATVLNHAYKLAEKELGESKEKKAWSDGYLAGTKATGDRS